LARLSASITVVIAKASEASARRAVKAGTCNVLFTCAGRRVGLVTAFREAAQGLRVGAAMLGTDTTQLSSGLQSCDLGFLVAPVHCRGYVRQLLSIVETYGVRLLVPTVDLDLKTLAGNRGRFESLGCKVLVSDPKVIDICQDKRLTYRFLTRHGFEAPRTVLPRSILAGAGGPTPSRPWVVKPWDGYASLNNVIVMSRPELAFFARRIPHAICQPYVQGKEYTCDVYVDGEGAVRTVVPRRRMEVRAGEVSKAQVVKDPRIMAKVADLARILGAGPGVITVQLIVTAEGNVTFIEINPRFGGGAPLSIKAGADFPKWLLQEVLGCSPRIPFDGFRDGLTMLRYDSQVWIDPHQKQETRSKK
jgi:carbamoyl-phosphate synthase large subunit